MVHLSIMLYMNAVIPGLANYKKEQTEKKNNHIFKRNLHRYISMHST